MILITGANGQLGQCFKDLTNSHPESSFIFVGSKELNIADKQAVTTYLPLILVSDGASIAPLIRAVDKAESDQKAARATNVTGVQNLAAACALAGIPLIHFSTDYVYHGRINRPLVETDPVSPKGVYARTKLAGERAASAIIRKR